jgi:hypothetical protein
MGEKMAVRMTVGQTKQQRGTEASPGRKAIASRIVHLLLLFLALCVAVTPVSADCPVSAPTFGTLGNCPTSMTIGSTCYFQCNPGFALSAPTSCLTGNVLSPGTCSICSSSSYLVWSNALSTLPKMTGPGATSGAVAFGIGMALSANGTKLVVGGPTDAGFGSVWTYLRNSSVSPTGSWTLSGPKLTGGFASGNFGRSLALSADGLTMAVGAVQDGTNANGAMYIYSWFNNQWGFQNKLNFQNVYGTTSFPTPGIGAGGGFSMAMSADGNIVASGTPNDAGTTGNTAYGAVWVFGRIGGAWSPNLPPKITVANSGTQYGFGQSVSLSMDGSVLAVGGLWFASGQGAVWIFTRSGNSWTQQPSYLQSQRSTLASQGWSVSLSSDGLNLAVGGTTESSTSSNAGAVWMWSRVSSSSTTWTEGQKLTGRGGTGSPRFGSSVSLSGDGASLLVGAYGDASSHGAVFLFALTPSGWTQQGTKISQLTALTTTTCYQVRPLTPAQLSSPHPPPLGRKMHLCCSYSSCVLVCAPCSVSDLTAPLLNCSRDSLPLSPRTAK